MPTRPALPRADAVPLHLRVEWSRKLRLRQSPGVPRPASAQPESRWFLYPRANQLLRAFFPSCPFWGEGKENLKTDAYHTRPCSLLRPSCSPRWTSAVHSRLTLDTCLEVVVVKGKSHQVQRLADVLISCKGVRHGGLVSSAPSF